jgi:hypothetical protein
VIEITWSLATFLVYAIPALAIGLTIMIKVIVDRYPEKKGVRYLSRLTNPVTLEPLEPNSSAEITQGERRAHLTKQLGLRLVLVYLAIGLFLLSSVIGTFYYVMSDALMEVNQASTGALRIVSSVSLLNPFQGGWIGTQPWYGYLPLPSRNIEVLHDPWSWILFTCNFVDNPYFFQTEVIVMFGFTVIFGLVFLIPLAVKRIRQSFVASLFLFMTSMTTMTRVTFGLFAQAWRLDYAGEVITFGIHEIPGAEILQTTGSISYGITMILGLFIVFVLIGGKLWRNHYPDHQRSHHWFMFFVALCYWGSLAILMFN